MRLHRASLLLVLALGLCWAVPAESAIALVSTCGDPSATPGPTCAGSGISTTGATLFVATNGTNSATCPTDSQSNSWTQIVNFTGGGFGGTYTLCYVNSPTTSGTHTFTCGGTLCGVAVAAYSGTDTGGPLDTSCSGTTDNGGYSSCAASVTPANNNSLIVSGSGGPYAGTLAVNAGLTIQNAVVGAGGVTYGADIADLVQGAAAAIRPGWRDNNITTLGGSLVAVFKEGGGGGGCTAPAGQLLLIGVGNCKGNE